jgi:hypothetical protein
MVGATAIENYAAACYPLIANRYVLPTTGQIALA